MALEEALVRAIMSGCLTITNCQIVIGDNTQMGDLLQSSSASIQNQDVEADAKLKSDKAKKLWGALVENHYCHVEGSAYVWDASQVEYGYMVHIVSDILDFKHPSSNRILWKSFRGVFSNVQSFEKAAQVAVSKNISGYESYKSWPNEAKKLRNFLSV